ncbi:helix-turn-helix domain-containing protein [Agarilytica rhodophyticola]|uniref:helix-turn-helix domain-containing protein n=1 Tax=Agarilytica rhodophyticola TaxID=1737490 RepID=UPI000B3482AB|nr:helix-turn-helix transcriptional regulator [Agarilytica rhodophyticola]
MALFFFANILPELATILETSPASYWRHIVNAASTFANLTLAPLFWLYVRGLTSEDKVNWRRQDYAHFTPALLGLITFVLVTVMPNEERLGLFSSERDRNSMWQTLLFLLLVGLYIVTNIQACCYIIATSRRLVKYRTRLMDLFASTAHLELRWISSLILLLMVYGLFILSFMLIKLFSDISISDEPLASILNMILIWTIALWGLRQQPELAEEIAQIDKSSNTSAKYEKSALSDDHIDRIASKIESAMQSEALYRDPDLSLRLLSDQINVMPNYVSQALNSKLGQTFFDYINGWRVKEAMKLLTESDDTVINISLAAGFNSRSSFYTAFKKITGKTPSAYRQSHTHI